MVRSHSFDILGEPTEKFEESAKFINSSYCAGVLGFPSLLPRLEAAGIKREKLIASYPLIAYDRFFDRSENGDGIMNVGACIPKKKMEDFVHLAADMPDLKFDLYAMGYQRDDIEKLNGDLGSPVNMIAPVEPRMMPAEYKKHRWLVYTGTRKIPTVGWPPAVAEAQASGVGICMKRVRPDLEDYVGGGGYLFDHIGPGTG